MKAMSGYKVKLYPTRSQEQELLKYAGACRFVYNYFLDRKTKLYAEEGENLSYLMMSKELTALRKELPWLNITRAPLDQTLRKLDNALGNFFKKRSAYPVFKKKNGPQSVSKFGEWRVMGNRLHIFRGLGGVRFRGPLPTGKRRTLTISRDAVGDWYASTLAEVEKEQPILKGTIGLDMGLMHLVTTSDGEKYENPKVLGGLLNRVRRDSKALSRTKKGSKTRSKKRLRLARTYRRVERVRTNGLHHTSTAIVRKNHTMIAVEDLNVRGMMQNRRLSRGISDASWSRLVAMLTYKQEWRGGKVVKVDRFFPSSKTCSDCGYVMSTLPLNVRQWTCPECGSSHDRDINAARNIKSAGERLSVEASSKPMKRGRLVAIPRETNERVTEKCTSLNAVADGRKKIASLEGPNDQPSSTKKKILITLRK